MKEKSQGPRAKSQRSSKHQAANAGCHAPRQLDAWERGCVVSDQPQQLEETRRPGVTKKNLYKFLTSSASNALRLVGDDTAALRIGFGFAALCFLSFGALAQTNIPVLSSNRYLIILETSRSMEARGSGSLQALQQILGSGMGGELRKGDSLGIWTYNSQLYTGRFPIQSWSPETGKGIAQKAMVFLQAQTCEKTGNFDIVFPTLEKVAKSSQLLTVILVSDGEQKIRGTGFDVQINKLYDQWRVEQAKAKMPFITILRALSGQWTNFTVTAAPWPVEMPPMPKLPEVARAENRPQPQQAKVPPGPPRSTNNLIISGKKIAESRAATSNTLPISPTQNGSSPGLESGGTSSPGIATPAAASRESAAANATSALAQSASSSPPPVSRAEVVSTAPTPPPVQSEKLSAPSTARDFAAAKTATEPQVVSGKIESEPATKIAPVLDSPPVQSKSTETSTSVGNAEQAAKTEVSANSPTQPSANKRAPSEPATVAVVQDSWFKNSTHVAITGFVLFLGIGAIAFLWAQRARAAKHTSLITRSLDRK